MVHHHHIWLYAAYLSLPVQSVCIFLILPVHKEIATFFLLQICNLLLHRSDIIYVYSAGVQGDVAQTFKDKMLKIGKNVVLETKMNELYYRASYCSLNCSFIILSYSGEIEAELRGVKKLKERHIPLLAITSYGDNTLSQYADYVLNVSTRERLKDNLGDFVMNISTMLILDILYVSIFNTDYSVHIERRKSNSQGFDLFRTSKNPNIR